MKKHLLILFVIAFPFFVSARKISSQAWDNLRDIHAWYTKNVAKEEWKPKTTNS